MGLKRFVVTPPQRVTPEEAERAYLSGTDRLAWPTQTRYENGELLLERTVSESASLNMPWSVEGHGRPTLSTGCLIEQVSAYELPLELARGTVNQLRGQLDEWRSIGLAVPQQTAAKVLEATRHLSHAAVTQEDRQASAERAERAIRIALDAAEELADTYAAQVLAARHRSADKLPTLLIGDLGTSTLDDNTAKLFRQTFNAAAVPIRWREVETSAGKHNWATTDEQIRWCRSQNLRVCGGPLLQLDKHVLPDWLYLWEDDLDNLQSFVVAYVSAVVGRYRGKVDVWQAAARTNVAEILSLSEEDNLRLTALCIQRIRELDPNTPVSVSIDQPWAEYFSRREMDFPPLHFVDTLARSGLELAAVTLEINLGYHPDGTLPRAPLEFSRQLDYWSLLGLPLLLSITVPSSGQEDPLAHRETAAPDDSTPESQQAWVARYVPLMLAKPFVSGVIWNQLRDGEPHDFPHGGLFDGRGRPKPALGTLAGLRQEHLK